MRILFTSNPGLGHVHPMVPLARALAAGGHEVRWAVAADARSRIEAAGFEVFPAGIAGPERRAAFEGSLSAVQHLPPDQRPERMFPAFFGEVCTPPMLDDLLRSSKPGGRPSSSATRRSSPRPWPAGSGASPRSPTPSAPSFPSAG